METNAVKVKLWGMDVGYLSLDKKAGVSVFEYDPSFLEQSDSYEDIFTVIRRLNLPYENSKQQYLRMVFNVIARNVDDHSKNFSFCINRDGVWRLSPAYDLTYSVDMTAPAYSNRHSLTVNGKNEDITREDLETVGQNNDIRDYKVLIDSVVGAVAKFEDYANELEIDGKLIKDIKSDFIKMSIFSLTCNQ